MIVEINYIRKKIRKIEKQIQDCSCQGNLVRLSKKLDTLKAHLSHLRRKL